MSKKKSLSGGGAGLDDKVLDAHDRLLLVCHRPREFLPVPVCGSGCRVWDLGFKVQRVELGVWGLGFEI